jgi:hypothetical protein
MFEIAMENELEALFADVSPGEREAMMGRLCAIAAQFNEFKAARAARINSMIVECNLQLKAQA